MPSPRIIYCKDSTIVEAWARVVGVPARYSAEDVSTDAMLIRRMAAKEFSGLKTKPAVVSHELQPEQMTTPFWTEQHTFGTDDDYLARFGRGYLSVHFRPSNARYDTYETTFAPYLKRWLEIYRKALEAGDDMVETVGFGYSNLFHFEAKDFDVSEWFKFQLAADFGEPTKLSLYSIRTVFSLFKEEKSLSLDVSIGLETSPEEDEVRVNTKIFAELIDPGNYSFADIQKLLARVHEAKEEAKETFFNFTTPKTRVTMGAVEAEGNAGASPSK